MARKSPTITRGFSWRTTAWSLRNAYWLARCSRLAYENEDAIASKLGEWGFEHYAFIDRNETQCFVASGKRLIVLAFRGTQFTNLGDWMTDARFRMVNFPAGGRAHRGFKGALEDVWDEILETIELHQDNAQSLWITGHSLGGALALLATARLTVELAKPVFGTYTFGQPRTADGDLALILEHAAGPRIFRFVNNNDPVPRVPLRKQGYRHVGDFRYFDRRGKMHEDLAWWLQLLDSGTGAIDDWLRPGPDVHKDHSMDRYIEFLARDARAPAGV